MNWDMVQRPKEQNVSMEVLNSKWRKIQCWDQLYLDLQTVQLVNMSNY